MASGRSLTYVWRKPMTWITVVATIALILAGVSTVLILDSRSQVSALKDDLAAADREIRQMEDDIAASRTDLASLARILSQTADDLGGLESEVGSIRGRSHRTSISDLEGEISAIRQCMNSYMDTVGAAAGGRYTYYYC